MNFRALASAGLSFLLLSLHPQPAWAASAVFGGGPFYSGGTAVMNTLRSSGFTTIILWCIHVDSGTGNLIYNDQLIVANGAYVGNSSWPAQLATLKTAPTSVNRIEVSVGSWGVDDFGAIRTLMNNYGTNTTSILYRNFAALKTATGADAVDFDDETLYDAASTVKFGQMLAGMGYKVTLCPYTYASFWQSVYSQLGNGIVDIVYLQCYAGGAGNNPTSWNSYFGGLKVSPGMWCANGAGCASGNDPASVAAQMASWKASADIPGGFMWLYDDMLSCSSRGTPADYANAINQSFESLQISPPVGFSAVAAFKNKYLPASTPYILSNTASGTLNWSLANTSAWLNVSATNGSLGNHASATVTISLNPAVATNLPLGQYSATVWFANLSSGMRWPRTLTLNTAITNWPITFSGCNAAVLAPRNATLSSPGATAFDIKNNYSFYEAGLNGSARGLPLNGTFVSLCQNGTAFQLRPYGSTNALMLGYNYPQSDTLTLNPAQGFNSLAVLASSANGGSQGMLVLNFTNGTHSPALRFNAQDWFNTLSNVALQGFGRLNLGNFNIEDNGDSNPNLYQTTFDLAALGLTQPISSITFSNPPGAGAQQNTAIFALSGMPLMTFPPAGLRATPRTNGTILLMWNSSVGATNYNVKRSTLAGGPYTLIGTTRGTSYFDTGLADGTIYCYVVTANGPGGESDNSAEVKAKPCSYEAWILSASPAAYWPLTETNGSTAYDLVSGHHGLHAGGYTLGVAGPPGAGFNTPPPQPRAITVRMPSPNCR